MSESQLLLYGQRVYLQCQQNEYLFTRGFIDDQLHLSQHPSPECEFTFEQKNYQIDYKRKPDRKQVIVFGTEVLIKHLYSNYYISFHEEHGNECIQLKKEVTEACYFELVPQRSFQHKGDSITLNSTFAILHSDSKTYLGSNIFQIDPLKNRVRMDLRNTKLLQSYHLTRKFSEQVIELNNNEINTSVTHHLNSQQSDLKQSITSRFLKKKTFQRQTQKQISPSEEDFRRATKKLSQRDITFNQKGLYLPISMGKQLRKDLVDCSMEKHAHTMWKACLKEEIIHPYLQDNDYIYFASSFKNKGIMTVSESNDIKTYKINFSSKQIQNQYECSALFVVEVQQQLQYEQKNAQNDKKNSSRNIYLRHLLTGRYFPFNQRNTKRKLKIVPLLPSSTYENKLPPFHIYFDGEFFPKQFKQYQSVCGFWLNKANKIQVNQILSLESMPHNRWIPYLSDYLDTNRSQKQQILRQFGFIQHIMEKVVPMMEGNASLFTLLFKMINKNSRNCKQMIQHLTQLLNNENKEVLVDILAQILNSGSSYVQKYVQPEHLRHQVVAFRINNQFSIPYIRIFRLFCGTYKQPCHRNQYLLFELFFGTTVEKLMLQSKLESTRLPEKFKFRLQFKQKQILIENSPSEGKVQAKPYRQLSQGIQRYVRQYFYLLGDCLKKNKDNLEEFHKHINYTLDQLIDILQNPELEDFHGPAINLINVAYLTPEHKYRLYVYIKDYEKMCFHGGLVALRSNPSIVRLLNFIHQEKQSIKEKLIHLEQLRDSQREQGNELLEEKVRKCNKQLLQYYSSSRFKRYLILVKHTIQNGYWRQVGNLELMVDTLSHLYRKKKQRVFGEHASYQQCHEQRNYMDSTVLIIDIAIHYLDIQINLCISNLITLPQQQVSGQVDAFLLDLQTNPLFKQHYDYFHLTEVQNSEMMQRSLILSRKYYEIKNIIFQKYYEAVGQLQLNIDFQPFLSFIKESIDNLAQNTGSSIRICQRYILNCLEGVSLEELTTTRALNRGFILRPAFKFKKVCGEFQNLAFKLGIFQVIMESIERYTHLRWKQKESQCESVYWKLLVILSLIKENPNIKRQLIVYRGQLIKLLCEQNESSFTAIDILEEIYKNNRSLIVADKDELLAICRVFVDLMERDHLTQYSSKDFFNVKINKLLNLIQVFLQVESKRIKVIFPLVLNELFDKDVLITYLCKLNNIQNQVLIKSNSQGSPRIHNHTNTNNHLFQVLLYRLTQTLEQKPYKMNFTLPDTIQLMNMIMTLQKDNLQLTFHLYSLFDDDQIRKQNQFQAIFRTTLNMICEIGFQEFKTMGSSNIQIQFSDYSTDVKNILIHMPILIRIVGIIVKGNKDKNKKSMGMDWLNGDQYQVETKIQFLQKLFLFNKFLTPKITQQLVTMIKDHIKQLYIEEQDVKKFEALDFSYLTIQQIKNRSQRLIDINYKQNIKQKGKLNIRRAQSRWGQRPSRLHEIAEVLKMHFSEQRHIKNTQLFKIEKARQFIQSLTFINKSDKTQLNTELKTFFLSFLTNRFPQRPIDPEDREEYIRQLTGQQKVLVDYGSAELVTTLLQERFKENYPMFIKLFQYGNKLLEGGNQQAQKSFYGVFLKDHKNRIFENIRYMIEGTTMCLKFCYYNYPRDNDNSGKDNLVYPDDNSIEGEQERQNYRLLLRRVFRFLQLLCENDNQELKKYIYQQTNQDGVIKYMSVNFLQIAINNFTQILDLAHNNLNYPWFTNEDRRLNKRVIDDLFKVLLSILQFLIEVCQYPALKNQLFICNTDFFDNLDIINKLTAFYTNVYDQNQLLLALQRRVVILLRGLLEEKHPTITDALTKKLAIEELIEFVKLSLSVRNINTREDLMTVMMPKDGKLIQEIQNVVDIIIVCKALGIELRQEKSLNKEIIDEITLQIRYIEVDFKGKITTISFCYRPIFNYLSKDTQQFFIKRFSLHQSRNDKLKDVINLRHIINQDIVNRKSRQLLISENLTTSLFHLSITLCFVLVVFQLFFFSVNRMGTALDELETSIIGGISILQFFTTFLYFVLWGIGVSSITRQKIKQKYRSIESEQRKGKEHMSGLLNENLVLLRQIYFQEDSSLHTVLMLSLSIIGCFIEVRAYSFVLLYIFARIQLLRDILSAISATWRQLLLVSLLSMAFNFIFGVLSINFYINVLHENQAIDVDIGHINSHCSTLIGCIDSLYAQRIIGQTPSRVGDSTHYGRWFSDAVYWGFFEIIIPNLTAAIIIDKFAWLRSMKQKMQNQERNKCLICFADKSVIERRGESFEHHKQKKHCIWDYFFYLYYLQKLKDNTQYTGLQYWIVQQLKNQQVDWFPLDQSQKNEIHHANSLFDFLKYQHPLMEANANDI